MAAHTPKGWAENSDTSQAAMVGVETPHPSHGVKGEPRLRRVQVSSRSDREVKEKRPGLRLSGLLAVQSPDCTSAGRIMAEGLTTGFYPGMGTLR